MGANSPKAVMARLLGKANAIATMDLPNNLARLANRLPAAAGLLVERLAAGHTLLPYYTRYQPTAVRERAITAMAGSGGSVHLLLGIPTFRTGTPAHLQFCPECLVDQEKRFGSPHWRCDHQLPGVLVCPQHGERLRRSSVVLSATNRHGFAAAGDDTCMRDCEPVTGTIRGEELDRAMVLARASASLLDRPADGVEAADTRSRYLAELGRTGLLRGRLSVNQLALAERFQSHWSGLLDRLEGVRLDASTETWLASLVRVSSGAQPPLQHLLLGLFLDAQPSVPPRAMRAYAPRHRPAKAERVKVKPAARLEWRGIDLAYAAELRGAAKAVRDAQPPQRVSVGAMERHLGRRDWLSKRQAKLPMSCAAAHAAVEDVATFQARRLQWHATICRAEQVTDPWILLRRAGLRGSKIEAAKAALQPEPPHASAFEQAA